MGRPSKLNISKENLEKMLKIYTISEIARAKEVAYMTIKRLVEKYKLK